MTVQILHLAYLGASVFTLLHYDRNKLTWLGMKLRPKIYRGFGRLRFVRRSFRYRLFQRLNLNFEFEVPFYGYLWKGNLNNFIDRSIFFFGAHEKEQMEFSSQFLNPKIITLDCGANVGNHTLFYSLLCKHVFAIEPNIVAVSKLKRRIIENNIQNISVLNIGVGSKDQEKLPLFNSLDDNLGLSSFERNDSKLSLEGPSITMRTIDSLIKQDIRERVGFIKIDVEGWELQVIQGAIKTIRLHLPVIQLEYSGSTDKKIKDILELLPMYTPFSLSVNRSFGLFNSWSGRLHAFNPETRSEVFLIPKTTLTVSR